MGKKQSKPLAARHGRRTAWARLGNGMVCVNYPLLDSSGIRHAAVSEGSGTSARCQEDKVLQQIVPPITNTNTRTHTHTHTEFQLYRPNVNELTLKLKSVTNLNMSIWRNRWRKHDWQRRNTILLQAVPWNLVQSPNNLHVCPFFSQSNFPPLTGRLPLRLHQVNEVLMLQLLWTKWLIQNGLVTK
jgi:hypothetical protein